MVHYFDEARVQQLLSVPDLLQGVREALMALTLGQVVQPLRMVMPIGEASNDGLLFLKPAQLGDALSTKLITLVPGNAQKGLPTLLSTIVLMDPATGQTLAVMEGNTITAMRTAAASAVAADALVPRRPGLSVGHPVGMLANFVSGFFYMVGLRLCDSLSRSCHFWGVSDFPRCYRPIPFLCGSTTSCSNFL